MSQRLAYLDSLRGLAALFVVGHHAFMSAYVAGQQALLASPLMAQLLYPLWYGRAGVVLFLVVSGFVLYHPIVTGRRGEEPYGRFIARRAWRILPPYYVACGLSLALILLVPAIRHTGTVFDTSTHLTWQSLWTHMLLINNITSMNDAAGLNYPLWTVPLEFQLYAVFPMVALLFRRLGLWKSVGLAVVFTLVCRAVFRVHFDQPPLILNSVPGFLAPFVLGMLAARLAQVGWGKARAPWLWVGGLLAVVLGCLLRHVPGGGMAFDTVWGLGFAAWVLAAGYRGRWLERPMLVFLGRFSYSTYLVHAPLLALVVLASRPWGLGPETRLGLLLLAVPGVLLVAYTFHRVFERPFLGRPPFQVQEATRSWGKPEREADLGPSAR